MGRCALEFFVRHIHLNLRAKKIKASLKILLQSESLKFQSGYKMRKNGWYKMSGYKMSEKSLSSNNNVKYICAVLFSYVKVMRLINL